MLCVSGGIPTTASPKAASRFKFIYEIEWLERSHGTTAVDLATADIEIVRRAVQHPYSTRTAATTDGTAGIRPVRRAAAARSHVLGP